MNIKVGQKIKMLFDDMEDNKKTEILTVKITRIRGDDFHGVLEETGKTLPFLIKGRQVLFGMEDILEVME